MCELVHTVSAKHGRLCVRWPTSRPCLLAFRFTAATVLLIDLAIVVTGVFLRKWLLNSRKSSFVHLRTGRPSDRRSVMAFRFTAATVRFVNFAIVVAGVFSREWFFNSRKSSFVHSRPRTLILPPPEPETLAVFRIKRAIHAPRIYLRLLRLRDERPRCREICAAS